MYSEKARVAIACLTYNHEKFIGTALESFVTQKLNQPFHVHVHDDGSSDNTPNIIRYYQKKYPHIIKATLHKKNYYSQGISVSRDFLFPSIKAKYVAICEGDDFFTHEDKLQKQVDFLDKNPDYAICFHQVIKIINGSMDGAELFPGREFVRQKSTFTLEDLLEANFIQTNSCMYRWRFNAIETPQKLIPENILPCDYYWHLLHAEKGKIGYIEGAMAAYNVHVQGLWNENARDHAWHARHGLEMINFSLALEKRYHIDHTYWKLKNTTQYMLSLKELNKHAELSALYRKHPKLYAQAESFFQQHNSQEHQEICSLLATVKS